jgi:hypothetical protein
VRRDGTTTTAAFRRESSDLLGSSRDGELVAQDEQLDLVGCRSAAEQVEPVESLLKIR